MMQTYSRQMQQVRLVLLMAEIDALKKCMINVYEQTESLHDPLLFQLSEMLDRKLNKFIKYQH
ncbi:Spo0E family sporulation regulatory protein-aspartic acid phosphatase [Paenibacillus agricola]|uniref:Spo0E family sporulation regulatory protein-aspartic acid phosphatase n=1 Tax=Paenibacillus agricola TaxID=2716264 RepID=A0ABX0J015_9BACL|nr:Spo0E family sporulation regulatory protein-aspartic acid phosphatase [Paenibacillus agricola]NHN29303.1 Spo0E family sporulation regulatory protein-aspartic acid phosphatase [Paenibacillus agricola]